MRPTTLFAALVLIGTAVPQVAGQKLKITTGEVPIGKQMPKFKPQPLNLAVYLPKGQAVPKELMPFTAHKGTQGSRRLLIPSSNRPGIDFVMKSKTLHVELVRPKVLPPRVLVNPFNLEARKSHLVPQFEATFASAMGSTITAAVFDGGRIRDTHDEFRDKFTKRIFFHSNEPLDEHATHVAGTIGASGVNVSATGMARKVKIRSYDFYGDDLGSLEQDGGAFQVSNHSYGPYSGWHPGGPFGNFWHWWGGPENLEDPKFGKYTEQEASLDAILHKHQHLLTFVSAGNDRGEGQRGPIIQPVDHVAVVITSQGLEAVASGMARTRDGGTTGLDTVTGLGLAKNVLCIGAVNDIPNDTAGTTISITGFSAFGPADDGRIKPDLVANGFQLFSTAHTGDSDYVEMSGTSMASPTACGIGALMWEHFRKAKDRDPRSDELKAVLIHTARDAGVAGPDPIFGWGAIDALKAGRAIVSKEGALIGDPKSNVVEKNQTRTIEMTGTGDPVRATLVWIDPPGMPNGGGIDDPTPALVNDLDLRLIDPSGKVHHPYGLDLTNLWNVAEQRPHPARRDRANRVDNVEVVDAGGAAGTWKIEIRAERLGNGGSQSFALVVSGLKESKTE